MEVSEEKILECLARELGAITINNHMLSIEVEACQHKKELNDSNIQAYTRRVLEQDAEIKQLRILIDTRKIKNPVKDV